MPSYPELVSLLQRMTQDSAADIFGEQVVPYLVDSWRRDYAHAAHATGGTDGPTLVERTTSSVSYLYDPAADRLVASWGVRRGMVHGAPATLQFTYWDYSAGPMPAVQQGTLTAGRLPVISAQPYAQPYTQPYTQPAAQPEQARAGRRRNLRVA